MNNENRNALHLFCKYYGESEVIRESAFFYWVDSKGFNLMAKDSKTDQWTGLIYTYKFQFNSILRLQNAIPIPNGIC